MNWAPNLSRFLLDQLYVCFQRCRISPQSKTPIGKCWLQLMHRLPVIFWILVELEPTKFKQFTFNEDSVIVDSYLRTQYLPAKRTLVFQPVNYLTSANHTPMGVFAKKPIPKSSKIDGLTAFLSEMPEEEVREGENDFSLIESGRLGRQWLMLGPLAFVNAFCKPNIEYKNDGNQWWEQPKLQHFSIFGNTD